MKTFAETFQDSIDHGDGGSVVLREKEFNEIQLDARISALKEAAEIACDWQKYNTRSASIQCLAIHDAILARIRELESSK